MNRRTRLIVLAAALAVMVPLGAYAASAADSGGASPAPSPSASASAPAAGSEQAGPPHAHGGGPGGIVSAEVLELLKLDAATLKEKLAAGATLAEVAAEQGVSREALKAALTAAFEARQAEQKERFAGKLDELVDSVKPAGKGDHPRGHGPHGGKGPGHRAAPDDTTADGGKGPGHRAAPEDTPADGGEGVAS